MGVSVFVGCACCSAHKGAGLLEVCVSPGVRGDLGRPKTSPLQNKKDFMQFLDA